MNPDAFFKDSEKSPSDRNEERQKEFAARMEDVLEKANSMFSNIQRVVEDNQNAIQDSNEQIDGMEGMVKKMRDMQKDIDEKIVGMKKAAAKIGIDIDKLLGGTTELAKKGKAMLQKKEDELKKKINEAVPPEACLKPIAKTKEQLTKERLGKTRGARKQWLPMR